MAVAQAMSGRSKCVRRQIGAVIVSTENFHTWIGYNGPPAEWKPQRSTISVRGGPETETQCNEWCRRAIRGEASAAYDNCITIHAEANALLKSDPALRKGGTIYTTSFPCWDCAKMIANSGIKKIVTGYDNEADAHRLPHQTMQMLGDSGLEVVLWTKTA